MIAAGLGVTLIPDIAASTTQRDITPAEPQSDDADTCPVFAATPRRITTAAGGDRFP
jgi:hypothetical protein